MNLKYLAISDLNRALELKNIVKNKRLCFENSAIFNASEDIERFCKSMEVN
jgi:hypothetical protein